jgi:hypothetical protein
MEIEVRMRRLGPDRLRGTSSIFGRGFGPTMSAFAFGRDFG